jgi:signal transduction histidine kinase
MFRVLYENASQAGAKNVTTRACRSGDVITIDVSDDGPGVPSEVRAKLFEPLVTSKKSGTGLGLALVRRVARAHSGDAELVDGSAEGGTSPRQVASAGGAHFRIKLGA